MIIYGALLIPILAAVILYVWFKHRTVLWEFAIPFAITFIFVFIAKVVIDNAVVKSAEYWGSFVKTAAYYEPWDEYIHETCTRTVSCGKDCETTEPYDCSYVRYHSAYWEIETSTGETVEITQQEYDRIKTKLGNEAFVDMHRNYHHNDGDSYRSYWADDSARSVKVTTVHSYDNKVKVADQSVFNFREVDTAEKRQYGLYDYPPVTNDYEQESLLGYGNQHTPTHERFNYINALLGHQKEVRLYVLLFYNQPQEAGTYQQWHWKGGNMNEFTLCIGVDSQYRVKWCYPISWTKNELLKVETKNFVLKQKTLQLDSIAGYLQTNLTKFERLDFKEFNYLTVEPPRWAVILVYILTIIMNVGLGYWIVQNDFEDGDENGRPYFRRQTIYDNIYSRIKGNKTYRP